MHCFARSFARLGSLLLLSGIVLAKENFLPDRDTPVPSDQHIPALDFARPLLFEDPVLNPAGTHFAAFSKNEELKDTLLVCEIATGKIEWSRSDVWRFDWISDQHLILNRGSAALRGLFQWGESELAVKVGDMGRKLHATNILPEFKRGLMPDTGYLWSWPAYDLPKDRTISIQGFWPRPDNGEQGFSLVLRENGQYALQRFEKKTWVDCPVDLNEITPIAVGDKPNEMIVLGPRAKGRPRAIQRMDVRTGTLGEVIYQDAHYDCLPWVYYKRGTREINGVAVPNSANRIVWLSENMKQAQSLINRQFPGMLARIVSTDIKESRFLIEVQSDHQPPIYYYFDQEKKSLGLIKNTAPWIEPARMRPMQVVAYKARDGTAIEGYLTLPAGASKDHPAPLVVDVHAGPWRYRATWRWDSHAQFLASRGYAVFQPNYRGSSGYDPRIEPGDRFDFQKMSNDVTDGVHMLIKSGLIDSKRVAIQGVGFGAYLSLCGVLEEPALYRGAVLWGGIFDWDKLFRMKDSRSMFDDTWLKQQLSVHGQNPTSPLQRREEIKIPLFFTRNLTVWDITFEYQSGEMYRAMKSRVPCVNFGDFSLYQENEALAEDVERLDKIEAFLTEHLSAK
jgi:pimeloyl-ACP methyl ester carboxylesterase